MKDALRQLADFPSRTEESTAAATACASRGELGQQAPTERGLLSKARMKASAEHRASHQSQQSSASIGRLAAVNLGRERTRAIQKQLASRTARASQGCGNIGSEYPYGQGAMIPLRNTVWPIAT